ncbi:MAG: helix-turn-helix domain-containing protein [Chloroflexota bacterium]|nr:helix-turn-helix domain-containing protein [Chloroflexota bacterium]
MRLELREWRERRLLTQRELAERVAMSTGQINRIERGIHEPRFSTIRKLAAALEVTPDELVEWEGNDLGRGGGEEPGQASQVERDQSG